MTVVARSTGAQDPVSQLEARVFPVVAQTVDALQVAALLEADGITDEMARTSYDADDVFALAVRIRQRAVPEPTGIVARTSVGAPQGFLPSLRRGFAVRRAVWGRLEEAGTDPETEIEPRKLAILAHGLVYLLPIAFFPAVLSLVEVSAVVTGLVLGAALAWIWAGVGCWLAFQYLGANRPAQAAKVLRLTALTGVPTATALSVTITLLDGGPWALVGICVGQMSFQLGVSLLVFFRHEAVVLAVMAPAVVAGAVHFVVGTSLTRVVAVLVCLVCTMALLGMALRATSRPPEPDPRWGTLETGDLRRGGLAVAFFCVLSAGYLLHAQSRYMTTGLEVSIGLLPLVTAMGVVELQASQFRGRARRLLARVQFPLEFAAGVRWLVARDLIVLAASTSAVAAAVLHGLAARDLLTTAGATMALAGTLLAGAYYCSFLLLGFAKVAALCWVTGIALAFHVSLRVAAPRGLTPLDDATAFAASALLLLLFSLTVLLPVVTQPRAHG